MDSIQELLVGKTNLEFLSDAIKKTLETLEQELGAVPLEISIELKVDDIKWQAIPSKPVDIACYAVSARNGNVMICSNSHAPAQQDIIRVYCSLEQFFAWVLQQYPSIKANLQPLFEAAHF